MAFAAGTHNADSQFQRQHVAVRHDDAESASNRARMQERSQQLKKDSAKLLEVATELKQYVDRTDENVLSLEVIRKAEQMEKLARDLKNRMKGE
jgi:hypothetical protein